MSNKQEQVVNIVRLRKSDLDSRFSKLYSKSLVNNICPWQLKQLAELRSAYKVCIELNCLDDGVYNSISDQLTLIENQ